MKNIYMFLTALLITVTYSCKKNAVQLITTPVDPATTSQIKFFNFSSGAPSINFYGNGAKISAVASGTGAESATGTTFGSVFPTSNYAVVSGGDYSFKGQIPSTATTDANLAIFTLPATIANGKFYTLYTSGIYNATAKTTDAFIVEDKLPADNAYAYVRLVNCISNAPQPFSLYVKNTTVTPAVETLVASNVSYKGASDFVAVPTGTFELYVRYASAPTVNVISRNGTVGGTVVSFLAGKVYTIGAKGDMTVTSTTATNRPLLDNTANR